MLFEYCVMQHRIKKNTEQSGRDGFSSHKTIVIILIDIQFLLTFTHLTICVLKPPPEIAILNVNKFCQTSSTKWVICCAVCVSSYFCIQIHLRYYVFVLHRNCLPALYPRSGILYNILCVYILYIKYIETWNKWCHQLLQLINVFKSVVKLNFR